jgi:hypothetical protein
MPPNSSIDAVSLDQSLPRCEGPKLCPFKDRKASIEFIKFFSEPDPKENHDKSLGRDGHVFEVLINSKPYILKIVRRIDVIRYSELITILQFKFYDPSGDRGPMSEKENRRVIDSVFEDHMDPFYAECRAYARIGEEKRNKKRKRDIAVPCYGFLSIPAEREEELYRRFGVDA